MAKGVATLMDAVFLILVSAIAAAIIFYSTSNYGSTLSKQANALLMEYYVRNAVRVVSNASVIRAGCSTPDYLLAYLKEKIYYNSLADIDSMRVLEQVLGKAFEPIGPAYDYAIAFKVNRGSDANVYVFSWWHQYDPASGTFISEKNCFSTDMRGLGSFVAAFVSSKIPLYSYSVPVTLYVKDNSGSDMIVTGKMLFYVWPSGSVGNLDSYLGEGEC